MGSGLRGRLGARGSLRAAWIPLRGSSAFSLWTLPRAALTLGGADRHTAAGWAGFHPPELVPVFKASQVVETQTSYLIIFTLRKNISHGRQPISSFHVSVYVINTLFRSHGPGAVPKDT